MAVYVTLQGPQTGVPSARPDTLNVYDVRGLRCLMT